MTCKLLVPERLCFSVHVIRICAIEIVTYWLQILHFYADGNQHSAITLTYAQRIVSELCESKKLHHFVFVITLSNQAPVWILARVYFNKCHTTVQHTSALCIHNRRAARHEMLDFIIAPNLWLPNTSDFCPVDYKIRILAVPRKWSVNILWYMLMSWGNVWLTVGQASSRLSLFKRLICGNLGWGSELRPEVDSLNIWYNPVFYCCNALFVHTCSYFIWCFM